MQDAKYDSMTGKPLDTNTGQKHVMKFDPMTGEPLDMVQETQKTMNFDPMTGKPLRKTEEQNSTGQGKQKRGKRKKFGIIFIVIVLLTGIGGYVSITSGIFYGTHKKIEEAWKHTLTYGEFAGNLIGIINRIDSDFGLSGEIQTEIKDIEFDYECNKSEQHQSLYMNVESKGDDQEQEIKFEINDKELKVKLPNVSNYVYTYNYTGSQKGAMSGIIKDMNLTQRQFDGLFMRLNDKRSFDQFIRDVKEEFRKSFYNCEVESIDEDTFEVNGKDRTCDGYRIYVTKDDVQVLYENVCDVIQQYLGGKSDSIYGEALYILLNVVNNAIRDMDDIEIEVYLYKSQIAAINLMNSYNYGQGVIIEFRGGETPMQSLSISNGKSGIYTIEGEIEEDIEKKDIYANGKRIATLEYNLRNGKYRASVYEYFDAYDYYMDDYEEGKIKNEISITGSLLSSRNSSEFIIDRVRSDEEYQNDSFQFKITKKSDVSNISGKELEVGKLDENSLKEIFQHINFGFGNLLGH